MQDIWKHDRVSESKGILGKQIILNFMECLHWLGGSGAYSAAKSYHRREGAIFRHHGGRCLLTTGVW